MKLSVLPWVLITVASTSGGLGVTKLYYLPTINSPIWYRGGKANTHVKYAKNTQQSFHRRS